MSAGLGSKSHCERREMRRRANKQCEGEDMAEVTFLPQLRSSKFTFHSLYPQKSSSKQFCFLHEKTQFEIQEQNPGIMVRWKECSSDGDFLSEHVRVKVHGQKDSLQMA